jgi:hypothetical protein
MRLNEVFRQDGFEILEGIISRGIATLYFEQGYPLAASLDFAKDNGLKICWLNVADQFQKAGFSNQRIISEFRELLSFCPDEVDIKAIEEFVVLDYHSQREKLWEFWGDKLIVE